MTPGRGLVVVADPDHDLRRFVRMTLGQGELEVVEAEDAAALAHLVASRRPDLVLVDAELPGGGGVAMARSLDAQPETRDVAVILLTGRGAGDGTAPDGAVDAAVDATLAKPFTAFSLLRKTWELLHAR